MLSAGLARFVGLSILLAGSLVQLASASAHHRSFVSPSAQRLVPGEPNFVHGRQGGGFGGGVREDVRLTAQFDRDNDGRLDAVERRAAREYAESAGLNRARGGRGG